MLPTSLAGRHSWVDLMPANWLPASGAPLDVGACAPPTRASPSLSAPATETRSSYTPESPGAAVPATSLSWERRSSPPVVDRPADSATAILSRAVIVHSDLVVATAPHFFLHVWYTWPCSAMLAESSGATEDVILLGRLLMVAALQQRMFAQPLLQWYWQFSLTRTLQLPVNHVAQVAWNCKAVSSTILPTIPGGACWQFLCNSWGRFQRAILPCWRLPLELQAGSVDDCPWNCRQGWLTIALGIPGGAGWQSPLEFQAGLVDDRPL